MSKSSDSKRSSPRSPNEPCNLGLSLYAGESIFLNELVEIIFKKSDPGGRIRVVVRAPKEVVVRRGNSSTIKSDR